MEPTHLIYPQADKLSQTLDSIKQGGSIREGLGALSSQGAHLFDWYRQCVESAYFESIGMLTSCGLQARKNVLDRHLAHLEGAVKDLEKTGIIENWLDDFSREKGNVSIPGIYGVFYGKNGIQSMCKGRILYDRLVYVICHGGHEPLMDVISKQRQKINAGLNPQREYNPFKGQSPVSSSYSRAGDFDVTHYEIKADVEENAGELRRDPLAWGKYLLELARIPGILKAIKGLGDAVVNRDKAHAVLQALGVVYALDDVGMAYNELESAECLEIASNERRYNQWISESLEPCSQRFESLIKGGEGGLRTAYDKEMTSAFDVMGRVLKDPVCTLDAAMSRWGEFNEKRKGLPDESPGEQELTRDAFLLTKPVPFPEFSYDKVRNALHFPPRPDLLMYAPGTQKRTLVGVKLEHEWQGIPWLISKEVNRLEDHAL